MTRDFIDDDRPTEIRNKPKKKTILTLSVIFPSTRDLMNAHRALKVTRRETMQAAMALLDHIDQKTRPSGDVIAPPDLVAW
jgi:hypothetical protein|tara:strand:+ start:332 stop:574 length:243 start_codon:yes stop_codon:yes gene_type:complete